MSMRELLSTRFIVLSLCIFLLIPIIGFSFDEISKEELVYVPVGIVSCDIIKKGYEHTKIEIDGVNLKIITMLNIDKNTKKLEVTHHNTCVYDKENSTLSCNWNYVQSLGIMTRELTVNLFDPILNSKNVWVYKGSLIVPRKSESILSCQIISKK